MTWLVILKTSKKSQQRSQTQRISLVAEQIFKSSNSETRKGRGTASLPSAVERVFENANLGRPRFAFHCNP